MESKSVVSSRLTRLLLAYTLCEDAVEHGRVLKEYVAESMFHAGIIAYYSVFKDKKGQRWFKDVLLKQTPHRLQGLNIKVRRPSLDGESYYPEVSLIDVFKEFESIRDMNLAHKDSGKESNYRKEWLRVPKEVAGAEEIDGKVYIVQKDFLSLSSEEKSRFLMLIVASIKIAWEVEGHSVLLRRPE